MHAFLARRGGALPVFFVFWRRKQSRSPSTLVVVDSVTATGAQAFVFVVVVFLVPADGLGARAWSASSASSARRQRDGATAPSSSATTTTAPPTHEHTLNNNTRFSSTNHPPHTHTRASPTHPKRTEKSPLADFRSSLFTPPPFSLPSSLLRLGRGVRLPAARARARPPRPPPRARGVCVRGSRAERAEEQRGVRPETGHLPRARQSSQPWRKAAEAGPSCPWTRKPSRTWTRRSSS